MNIIYTKIYEFTLKFEDIRPYNQGKVERRMYDLLHAIVGNTNFKSDTNLLGNSFRFTVILQTPINHPQLTAITTLATGIAWEYDLNNEQDEQ